MSYYSNKDKAIKELITDGYNISVDDSNKNDYVKAVCNLKLVEEIEDQIESF
jgi:hypothetical protein